MAPYCFPTPPAIYIYIYIYTASIVEYAPLCRKCWGIVEKGWM